MSKKIVHLDMEYKNLDKELNNMLKEPDHDYYTTAKRPQFTFNHFMKNKLLLMHTINAGVSYSFFETVQSLVPITENDWAQLLNLSTKSLQRYKAANKKFAPLQSEKIIEMGEVTTLGLEVFENMVSFKTWLYTPCFALGNETPASLLTNNVGIELVLKELNHINHGIFA